MPVFAQASATGAAESVPPPRSSAHRFLHERADPCLVGGGQLLQREGDRPQVPSSRFALSLKPKVAYLALNLCALWKKQTTLPSLAYAGIPYQVLGQRAGALPLMMAWSRSAMARSGFGISAIFASTSRSASACFARGPRRASAFSSWARSFIAARSSSVNPLTALPVTVALLADFCVSVFGPIEPPHTDFGWTPHRSAKADPRYSTASSRDA